MTQLVVYHFSLGPSIGTDLEVGWMRPPGSLGAIGQAGHSYSGCLWKMEQILRNIWWLYRCIIDVYTFW